MPGSDRAALRGAARSRDARGRRAGARDRARPVQALDQGRRQFAGERGRHRGQRSAAARGSPRWCRAPAGCRRKPRRCPTALCRWPGWSTRSTAPAPISPAAPTGPFRWRWWRTRRPVLAALYAPATDEMFLAVARRRRRAQRRRHRGQAGARPRWREIRRAEALSRQTRRHRSAHPGAAQGVFAGAAVRARRARRASMPPSPRPAATIGTWRRPIFWCTKPAAC